MGTGVGANVGVGRKVGVGVRVGVGVAVNTTGFGGVRVGAAVGSGRSGSDGTLGKPGRFDNQRAKNRTTSRTAAVTATICCRNVRRSESRRRRYASGAPTGSVNVKTV